jgi:hypothetical protein
LRTPGTVSKIVSRRQHGVAAHPHGHPLRLHRASSCGCTGPANVHPLRLLDIAAAFPAVTPIYDHGGIQAGSWERF